MKKRLAIVLMAALLAVMSSQAVFADGGKETMPRPEVEVEESAVPEGEPLRLTPDKESLKPQPEPLTPSGSLGKEPQEVLVEPPGEPDWKALKKQEEEWEKENKLLQELYDSLSEEERAFIWQKIEEEKRDEVRADVKKAEELKVYLEENLFESQYTFITAGSNRLTIGVPSAKQFDKVDKLCREYGEEDVAVEMQLCRYSYKELMNAQKAIKNGKAFAEVMGDESYYVENKGDHLVLHCPYGKPLGLSSWFEQSGYQDMLRISDGTKPLPDGPGL